MAFTEFINKLFIGYEKDIYAVLLYTLGVVIYAIVIWNFYTNLSKRDLIKFNLHNFDFETTGKKFFDLISYFIKYLIITPILSFFWFLVILFFLFVLAKSQTVYNILIIGITLITATRISAYYNEKLSEELAKIIPLTLLALFVVDPTIFSIDLVISRFNELPKFFPLILRFFIIIALLEFVLRIFYELKELITGD